VAGPARGFSSCRRRLRPLRSRTLQRHTPIAVRERAILRSLYFAPVKGRGPLVADGGNTFCERANTRCSRVEGRHPPRKTIFENGVDFEVEGDEQWQNEVSIKPFLVGRLGGDAETRYNTQRGTPGFAVFAGDEPAVERLRKDSCTRKRTGFTSCSGKTRVLQHI